MTSAFLEKVGDAPFLRVLQVFLEGRELSFTRGDVMIDIFGLDEPTVNLLVDNLFSSGYLIKVEVPEHIEDKTLEFFKLNEESFYVKKYLNIFDAALREVLDKYSKK